MEIIKQTSSDNTLFVNTFLKAWATQVTRINEFLESVTDEELLKEIAPGKNSGIYLLGHLTAVNDGIIPLLGLGKRLYPQLEQIFVSSPDKSGKEFPSIDKIKSYWNDVNEHLIQHFSQLEPEEWLTRHEAISAEDYAREPHRNKLNVLIHRTTHLGYHLGQMVFLKEKK
jgi:uncharacterized damage-inducible protein DinB